MHAPICVTDSRLAEALTMEHYRLHTIERWPEGARKDAALAGVRSALAGMRDCKSPDAADWMCIVCGVGLPEKIYRIGIAVAA